MYSKISRVTPCLWTWHAVKAQCCWLVDYRCFTSLIYQLSMWWGMEQNLSNGNSVGKKCFHKLSIKYHKSLSIVNMVEISSIGMRYCTSWLSCESAVFLLACNRPVSVLNFPLKLGLPLICQAHVSSFTFLHSSTMNGCLVWF